MSPVRVQRMINSRRVHIVEEPVPFRPQRYIAPGSCDDRGTCVAHPLCPHRDCGEHPLCNEADRTDPKVRAWFWRLYLGGVAAIMAAAAAYQWLG